jgi:hypothetical protein
MCRLKAQAEPYPRYGYPIPHAMLKNEGLVINPKRTYRIYREEGAGAHQEAQEAGAAQDTDGGAWQDQQTLIEELRQRSAHQCQEASRAQRG